MLERQVKILENKLERVTQASSADSESEKNPLELEDEAAIEVDSSNITSEDINDSISKDNSDTDLNTNTETSETSDESMYDSTNTNENYDIVLKVKPEKVPQIKSQIIDGKKYLVIPIDENEQTTVNGIDSLI